MNERTFIIIKLEWYFLMFLIKNLETFTKYLQGRHFLSKLLSLETILMLAYSYITLLIWDLYFHDLTLYFTAFFKSEKYKIQTIIDQMTKNTFLFKDS